MSELQDLIGKCLGPVEYFGGPLDGKLAEDFVAPMIIVTGHPEGYHYLRGRMPPNGRIRYWWSEVMG